MPYAPGVEYRGGDYLYGAITGAARGIAGGLEEWQKKHDETQQKLQESGVLMDYAQKKGYVTPDQFTKYISANANQKADMAGALAKTIALDQHDTEVQAEQQFRQQQLAQAWQIANLPARVAPVQPGTEPGSLVTNPLDPSDIWGQYGAEGRFIPAPKYGGGAEDTGVVSSPLLDADKKPVPGKVVVTKPGSNAFSVQDVSQMPEEVQLDPTGNFKWNNKTRSWDTLPAKTARRMQTQGQELTVPTETGGIRSYLPDWFNRVTGGGAAAPTPTPTPGSAVMPPPPLANAGPTVPAVTPMPNATPGVPYATQLSAQDQQALAWAQGNPNDPRAAAILQKLGY